MFAKQAAMEKRSWLIVGISGITCGGKTTLSNALHEYLKDPAHVHCLSETVEIGVVKILHQDDYYYPDDHPNHEWNEHLNHINYEVIDGLDMARMCDDLHDALGKRFVLYSKSKPTSLLNIMIIEGFVILNHSVINRICQLKFHVHLPYEKCFERRLRRTYEPPDCVGYFEVCVWPMYEQNFEEIQNKEDVVLLNGAASQEKLFAFVFNSMRNFL